MKTFKAIALVLVLLATVALAQKKAKKPAVPAIFDQAKFVYVEATDGEEFKRGLLPEDRMAIADLRDALNAWGRYTYTVERDKADLVFVVRKGRLASAEAGGEFGDDNGPQRMQLPGSGRQQQQQRPTMQVGGEAGPREDMLEVFQMNANGKLSGPLWIRTLENGLNPPRLLLFTQFKEAVDKAYPRTQNATTTKP